MNILIIGASGYIGKKLIKRLCKEGYSISVVIRKTSNIDDVEQYIDNIIFNDEYEEVYERISKIKPECYINVSGKYYGSHNMKTIGEMIEANISFPTLVLDAVVKAGCKNVIHTSSYQQCYQGEDNNPINLYAAVKQSFEDILKFYVESGAIKGIVLQLFDTYGADDTRNKIFNRIRNLSDEECFELSPGRQKLYFCYIDDVVEAYIVSLNKLIKEKKGGIEKYSVRGSYPIELKQFIDMYLTQIGKRKKLKWGAREYMEREIMNPTGYGKVLDQWQANITYEKGIKLCVEYDKNT